MDAITWRELIVTDLDGDEWGPLGELVDNAPANLDTAQIVDGQIAEWPGFFISAPGEAADSDTPRGDVDWAGFGDAIAAARG